jgi:hypothetical protein
MVNGWINNQSISMDIKKSNRNFIHRNGALEAHPTRLPNRLGLRWGIRPHAWLWMVNGLIHNQSILMDIKNQTGISSSAVVR